jgi:hypothetical protein
MRNLESTCLGCCGDDPILYTIATNDTWTHSMHEDFPIHMVYEDEDGMLMLHNSLFTKINHSYV